MRNLRTKRKSKNRNDKLLTIFTFFIMAPILSIIIGILIVQNIILPYFQQTYQTDVSETGNVVNDVNIEKTTDKEIINERELDNLNDLILTVDSFDLYNIQVGSFSEIENAKSLIKELREKGLGGYIVKIDNYKVFNSTYLDREECDKILTKIREFYPDAFVNIISVGNINIKYNNKEKQLVKRIDELIDILKKSFNEETILWYNAFENDKVNIINAIKKNNIEINKLLSDIDKTNTNTDLVKIIDNISNLIMERENILKKLQGNEEPIQEIYSSYYKLIFDFIKIFK